MPITGLSEKWRRHKSERIRQARTRHGRYSVAIAERREAREKRRQLKLESKRLRQQYRELKALIKLGLI